MEPMTNVAGEPLATVNESESIRVAFDAGFLNLPPSGIGTYVSCLLGALADRPDIEIVHLQQPDWLRRLGPRAMRLTWDAIGVEVARRRSARSMDLLHVPALSAPVISGVPIVATIHDVIPFVLPEYRSSRAMRAYLDLMRRTVRRARIVVTPSHASAREIARVLGMSPARIRVTPLAASPGLRPAPDPDAVRSGLVERFGIDRPYLLSIAGFDRRKNVPLLVRAFARALPSLPDDVVLVLAGAPHSENPLVFPPVEPVVHEEGIADRVVLTGKVSDDERTALYQGALGYVTPSSYEGFGLTALEAMACGVPVIASNLTSLPEVVGDAGLLVEPDIDAVAHAISRLVGDERLRSDLSRRGLDRSSQFTWERTARLTVEAYRAALADRVVPAPAWNDGSG